MSWIEVIGAGFVAFMAYGFICVIVELIGPGDETEAMRQENNESDYSSVEEDRGF